MKMFEVPQPESNSRLGFHYFPDEEHYRSQDLKTWLPRMEALGVSWLTVRGSMERAIPETFLTGIIEAGIEPIIHIPALPIQPVDLDTLSSLARVYASWGVHYLVLYDRPNARQSWQDGMFDRSDLVNRFLNVWLPAARVIHEEGMLPVFPPLEQGGTYWDMSFLSGALENMICRTKTMGEPSYVDSLLETLILSVYAFAGSHPPDWGRGGSNTWHTSQPYLTPDSSQDQLGFWSFDWYSEVLEQKLGDYRPILMVAGGAKAGQTDPNTGEAKNLAWHTSCNLCIARAVSEGDLPDYLLNVNYWVLSATQDSAAASQAWYKPRGGTLPVVHEMQHLISSGLLGANKEQAEGAIVASHNKRLTHYVLLPIVDTGPSEWHWRAAGHYVREIESSCGYSQRDAANAERVTLIGTDQQISAEIERSLKNAGCKVDRVAAADYEDLTAHLAMAIQ